MTRKIPLEELTTRQAAAIANVSDRAVRGWCRAGILASRKQPLGDTYIYLIAVDDLMNKIKERKEAKKNKKSDR